MGLLLRDGHGDAGMRGGPGRKRLHADIGIWARSSRMWSVEGITLSKIRDNLFSSDGVLLQL